MLQGKSLAGAQEDGYRTSSPGPVVSEAEVYDSNPVTYITTSRAQGTPGKRGWEEWKSGGRRRSAAKKASCGHDVALVSVSKPEPTCTRLGSFILHHRRIDGS